MSVDPSVLPGLLLLALELLALAAVGFIVARVALGQTDDRMALAQGLVIGPALWGLLVNFVLHLLPGLAGAVAGWAIMLSLGAGLAWRAKSTLRVAPGSAGGFVAAALVVFWIALAGRQTLSIPDSATHLGLAATTRAGEHPPVLPWNAEYPAAYHYGVDMLIGLLATPFGPDLAFVTELLGAYVWTGLVLVVATALMKRASLLSMLLFLPLLLTTGAWTPAGPPMPDILQIPIPTGTPAAGLRTSLGSLYWPDVSLPWQTWSEASPPNIWKPHFVLAYAMAVVVLERIATRHGRTWPAVLTLAALLGFLGLVDETVALVVLGLWVLLEVSHLIESRDRRFLRWNHCLRSTAGPAIAAFLLAVSGGIITDAVFGSSDSGLSLGWVNDVGSHRPFGRFASLPGGIGFLGVGPLTAVAVATLLAWRQRLVVALVVGTGVFLIAALAVQYAHVPHDVNRFDGHARNFALLALLAALAGQLPALGSRPRYAAAALMVALVTWPTVVEPARGIALALGRGVQLTNTSPEAAESDSSIRVRYRIPPFGSERIAGYIQEHTAVDARILSPRPQALSVATGRPNASGFAGLRHLRPATGPEYADAIRFLEPAAVRRLNYSYVHAPDDWIASLPDRAQRWLANPQLFALIVRDGADALYSIQPAFLRLNSTPAPQSFEALRRAVPASAAVYLTEAVHRIDNVRLASVLAHTRLFGEIDPTVIHLLTKIPSDPSSDSPPDVVVVARDRAVYASTHSFSPIWFDDTTIVYSANPAIPVAIDPPPKPESNFAVRIAHVRTSTNRIGFAATFTDHAPTRWTGQDWLVIPVASTPLALPTRYAADGYTLVGHQWFAGQIVPGGGTVTHRYEFDAPGPRLAVQSAEGTNSALRSTGAGLRPGAYVLAARLRHGHLQAAIIPVLKLVIAVDGSATYEVFQGDREVSVNSCPERLHNTDSCRQLAADG